MSPSNDKDRKVIARDRITAGGCEFPPTATIARIGLVALRKGELVRDEMSVVRLNENAVWVGAPMFGCWGFVIKPVKKHAAAVRKTEG
jgi:hypothetical protein